MKMQRKFVIIAVVSAIFITSGSLWAENAEHYKKAAGIAAEILSEYLKSPHKLIEQDGISINYNILAQQGDPGKGSREACSMYLTYYSHKPHPHQGNFKHITELPDSWKFKKEYGKQVCERKFSGNSNELIRCKSNYSLQPDNGKAEAITTMAFIDFYAGADRSGYFSFSLNRSYPVTNETRAQLEAKGHGFAVSDSEKIIEAIRAGLSGKKTGKVKPPEVVKPPIVVKPPEIKGPPEPKEPPPQEEPERWLTLSPTEIVKTHFAKSKKPVTNPIFAALAKTTDLSQVKPVADLDLNQLECLTANERQYSLITQSLNQSSLIFVSGSAEKSVSFMQLADGKIAFSPLRPTQEALEEAARIATKGMTTAWFTFRQKISPQELMVLRAMGTLNAATTGQPELPGFTLGQILVEMGNPDHTGAIGILPESSRNALFAATLNRNDVAVAVLTLQSQHLVKRTFLAGQHYFALSSSGQKFINLFAPENQLITISLTSNDSGGKIRKPKSKGSLAIFAAPNLATAIYLSGNGEIFCGLPATAGILHISPEKALLRLIRDWL